MTKPRLAYAVIMLALLSIQACSSAVRSAPLHISDSPVLEQVVASQLADLRWIGILAFALAAALTLTLAFGVNGLVRKLAFAGFMIGTTSWLFAGVLAYFGALTYITGGCVLAITLLLWVLKTNPTWLTAPYFVIRSLFNSTKPPGL